MSAALAEDSGGDRRAAAARPPRSGFLVGGGPGWREGRLYLACLVLTMLATTVMLRLWRAIWSVPFVYGGDSVSSAAHFKTTLQTGWYESQPDLGYPYGQHYHDFPFSDDLHPAVIRLLGVFTRSWPVVFNLYYVLGYPLAALAALWFLRRCGLAGPLAVVLSVLYAVTPYHLYRNEGHFFLGEYYAVPLAMGVVLAVIRGQAIWGSRSFSGRGPRREPVRSMLSALTGRGAATALILLLITLDGAYYAVFTAVLLAAAAVLALLRTHDWRRLGGAVVAGAVLGAVLLGAMLPDIVYECVHGSDAAAFVRAPSEAERYALKFAALIMPAPGHPVTALALLRSDYDTKYPLPGEDPALGAVGAFGFLILLSVPALVMAGRWVTGPGQDRDRRGHTMSHLSWLTAAAFLAGTVGGLGTGVSFLTPAIRGWNRISIFIVLMALAGLGLALEGGLQRLAARSHPKLVWARGRFLVPAVAAAVLILGVADQSISVGQPAYQATAVTYDSDQAFVDAIQVRVPAGSPIFQLPYIPFPEGGYLNKAIDSDQLKLFLHSTTLQWSGGGIKGRPQTNWPGPVSTEPAARMIRNLAIVGFVGVVIDRHATPDHAAALLASLTPFTGPPQLESPDRRWVYLSLAHADAEIRLTLTPRQRAAAEAGIVHISPPPS